MKSVYLAGAITGTDPDYHLGWRNYVTKILSKKYIVLNPLHQAQYDGNNGEAIIKNDLRMIAECDVLLVNGNRPSWGTAMEMFFAYQLHKLIFVVIDTSKDMEISPWLVHHVNVLFTTMDQAINYLMVLMENT